MSLQPGTATGPNRDGHRATSTRPAWPSCLSTPGNRTTRCPRRSAGPAALRRVCWAPADPPTPAGRKTGDPRTQQLRLCRRSDFCRVQVLFLAVKPQPPREGNVSCGSCGFACPVPTPRAITISRDRNVNYSRWKAEQAFPRGLGQSCSAPSRRTCHLPLFSDSLVLRPRVVPCPGVQG